jgi:hypothetical protein
MKTRWEYKVIGGLDGTPDCEAQLNALGDEGWEAIACQFREYKTGPESWVAVLKRQV